MVFGKTFHVLEIAIYNEIYNLEFITMCIFQLHSIIAD